MMSALEDWVNLHHWYFSTVAHAVVHYEGGARRVLDTRKVLVYGVEAVHRTEDSNPAALFQFKDFELMDEDAAVKLVEEGWESWKEICRLADRHVRIFPGVGRRPFIGVLPAIVLVRNANVVIKRKYALFHPVVHHVPDSLDDTCNALWDLVGWLQGLVNFGILFRATQKPGRLEPDKGVLTRRRRVWRWESISAKWAAFNRLPGRPKLPVKSGLSPKQLLTLLETTYVDIWYGAITGRRFDNS